MHGHPHLIRLAPPAPKQASRPAKVVQLESRRQARLEAAQAEQPRPRPAA